MIRRSVWRIALAAIAAFAFSSLYYGLLVGTTWRELSGTGEALAPWQPVAQLARNLVTAATLAFVFRRAAITDLLSAIGLALPIWLGFGAMAIAGSVIHEGYPLALFLIHAADQLGTLLIMAACLSAKARPSPAIPAGGR